MDSTKYIVLVVEYNEKHEENIENLLKRIKGSLNKEQGRTYRVYQGSDHTTISALKSIMKLTE